ncbi:d-2-hydroxyglutarate dehydrogenase, mitochondrial-like protein [Sarcoptes scabiei]|nr:d-2-hydroxyglutarate dehydrogenase, mitochondrial-like protein [Sarcoptes scabiei]
MLGSSNVLLDDLNHFNLDWMATQKGRSKMVLLPKNTRDVASILKHCHRNNLKCVVQSGNTSLVGGSVPFDDEIIISMTKMNKILEFDEITGVLQCETGCILQELEEFVNAKNRLIPYDLGAKGSCLIGGNLATNAGGLRFIRFGPLSAYVLGLEVVLPNGTVLDLMSTVRKDNTGYHLRHLFIGSEGTLGIMTKVSLLCPREYRHKKIFLIALESFNKLVQLFQVVQEEFAENLSLFEMMDESSMNCVLEHLSQTKSPPFRDSYPFYSLFELTSNDDKSLENRIENFLEKTLKQSIIADGTYSGDNEKKKFDELKSFRELIPSNLTKDGHVYKYDVSLPLKVYYELVEEIRRRLSRTPYKRICGYGHIADGNLHLNITSEKFQKEILEIIEPFLYEFVAKYRGSISAEHGIGVKKKSFLHYSKTPEAIELMREIKNMIDPKTILNPNVLF